MSSGLGGHWVNTKGHGRRCYSDRLGRFVRNANCPSGKKGGAKKGGGKRCEHGVAKTGKRKGKCLKNPRKK